jgi:hypothetical protein
MVAGARAELAQAEVTTVGADWVEAATGASAAAAGEVEAVRVAAVTAEAATVVVGWAAAARVVGATAAAAKAVEASEAEERAVAARAVLARSAYTLTGGTRRPDRART